MKGREGGAGRAAKPRWLRQGAGAVSLHGAMWVLCSQPPASQQREVGEAPAPLGLSGFYSNSLLKLTCGSLATPHARKSFAAQQLAPVDSVLHWNGLYVRAWHEPSQRDSPSPAGSSPSALPQVWLLSNPMPAACTTPHLREPELPELLLNSVGAEAAQQREVPALHLQHREMRSPRVAPDVVTTAAIPGSLFICSLVPEAPAAGAAPLEQLSHSPPRLLGKGWQLCLNPLSPAAGRKPLPDSVLKRLRWENSCPILLTRRGGGKAAAGGK